MDPSSEEGTKKRKHARVVCITLAKDKDIRINADGSVRIVNAVRPTDDEVINASKEDPQFTINKKRETNRLTMILKKHLIGDVPDNLLARMIEDVEDGKVMNGATTAAWREFDQLVWFPHLFALISTRSSCKLCSVRNCMNDLIVNVALEVLYIHEGGGSDGVIDS